MGAALDSLISAVMRGKCDALDVGAGKSFYQITYFCLSLFLQAINTFQLIRTELLGNYFHPVYVAQKEASLCTDDRSFLGR